MELLRTPLYEEHKRLGARLVEFGGWDMPVQYSGILAEHRAVRSGAGVFDISHMGEFRIEGKDALAFLQRLFTNNAALLQVGDAQYSLLCRPDGTIIDDTFIYHLPESTEQHPVYMVIVNASNITKDFDWLQSHLPQDADVQLTDISNDTGLLALQGPAAESLLQPLVDTNLAEMRRNTCRYVNLKDSSVLLARTGYTGEDGFEIAADAADVVQVWQTLLSNGQNGYPLPCGLGARDTLRLEARYALYGHEIDDTTNPIEAGLGWAVKLDKGDFIGREAIAAVKEHGAERKLIGFTMLERGIARAGYPIIQNGERVGYVTSGSPSPTLNRNIGTGYVPTGTSKPGTEIEILVRDQPVRARIVKTPFYKNV